MDKTTDLKTEIEAAWKAVGEADQQAEEWQQRVQDLRRKARDLENQGKILEINPAQQLALEMIRMASFNSLDGPAVADALVENKRLWKAALMPTSGLTLRDLPKGYWHVDTLFLACEPEQLEELKTLVDGFNADEVQELPRDEAQALLGSWGWDEYCILRVWWD